MTKSLLGELSCGDADLVRKIDAGRDVRLSTVTKLFRTMRAIEEGK